VQIERTYYGVITDAIEGCFAFNLDQSKYGFDPVASPNLTFKEAADKAKKIEEKIIQFYSDVAAQCQSLMADIPIVIVFVSIANKRKQRLSRIQSLSIT
jgi:hypothetical protein